MRQREIAKAVEQGFSKPDASRAPAQKAEQPSLPLAEAPVQKNEDLIQPAPTPELNPRTAVFRDIAKRANARADAEAQESYPEVDEDRNPVAPAAETATQDADLPDAASTAPDAGVAAAPSEGTQSAPAPAAPAAPPGIDPETEYEFMVDGRPVKLKGSQVRERVQKGEAADYRLNLATQLLETARQQAAQLQQLPAQPAAARPAQQLTDAELAQFLQFGQPEQAAAAIAEIRRRPENAVTQEAMANFMRREMPAIVRNEIAFDAATRFAQTEYGDLLSDPYLRHVFLAEEDKRRKAGNVKPYEDLYREIGEDLRKHFNRPKPAGTALAVPAASPAAATPAPTRQAASAPTRDQRIAAKAAAPAAPRLASARLEGGEQQAKPKSTKEIIEQMQASRGQVGLRRA